MMVSLGWSHADPREVPFIRVALVGRCEIKVRPSEYGLVVMSRSVLDIAHYVSHENPIQPSSLTILRYEVALAS